MKGRVEGKEYPIESGQVCVPINSRGIMEKGPQGGM